MRLWDWRDARGLSLVEMMVVIAVLALVTGGVMSIFMTSLQAYWKGSLNTQVQQGNRIGLDRLTRDLRQAGGVCSNTNPGCGVYSGFTFITNGGLAACPGAPQISFVLPHYALVTVSATLENPPGGTQIWMPDSNAAGQTPYKGSYVSYYLAASAAPTTPAAGGPLLQKTVYDINGAALSTVTIASNITGLTFTDSISGGCPAASSRRLTVNVKASQTTVNQSDTDNAKMDIFLRNNPLP